MKTYSFPRGGFTYEDVTAPQKGFAKNAYLPAISVIPFGGSNRRVQPLVSLGDTVREGMLIGKAFGAGSVNVHATVPGRIIRKVTWRDINNLQHDAFVIRMEGAFEKLGKREEYFSMSGLSCYDLQRIIFDYGIMEMENPGRPLAEIISAVRKTGENTTLVVRCVFDDPWMVADYTLCMDRIREVILGASIVAKACSKVSKILFAVSHKEKDLIEKFNANAGILDFPNELVNTGSKYPQRNKRELELALRQYEKKNGMRSGAFLILGPSVLAAVHDAVLYKKPPLDRYVAVGGSAVQNPKIMKVRIGTRISELIDQCGGLTEKTFRVIAGSVLSGREVRYLDEPVDQKCYAIIAMKKKQNSEYSLQNCINCGECRAVCPVGLDPQYIYKKISASGGADYKVTSCHGCGCCKIVCPSALPLSETIMHLNPEAENV